mgnify:FL=1
MQEILAILLLPMQWLIMKKDAELPWVTRIARWAIVAGIIAFLVIGIIYGSAIAVKEWKAVLGQDVVAEYSEESADE